MKDFFRDLIAQLNELLAQQSLTRRIMAGAFLVLILGLLAFQMWRSFRPIDYEVLYSDMNADQAKYVIDELNLAGERNFKVDESPTGWTISVPEGKATDWRLKMATDLDAVGGGASWDIFDVQTLTTTNEQFKVKKYRALRGELARTIASMEMVKSAKVDLAIPDKSLFIREENVPTASVLVELMPQQKLDKHQVETIQALVANSVEKMTRDHVVVSDTLGNELSKPEEVDLVKAELDNEERIMDLRKRHQTAYESTLEEKILELLEPIFRPGHVKANVSVDFDYTQKEENSTKFLEPVALSSAEIKRYFGDEGAIAIGVAGAAQHVENVEDPDVEPDVTQEYVEENIRNNKVGQTEIRTLYAPFKIKRVTAGVVVDDKPTTIAGNGQVVRTPLTRQDITKLEELVQGSISFNERREDGGFDVVNVRNISFSPEGGKPPASAIREFDRKRQIRRYMQYGFWLAVFVLLIFFVVRPLMTMMKPRMVQRVIEQAPEPGALPPEEPDLLTSAARMAAGLPGKEEEGETAEEPTSLLKQKSEALDDEILDLAKSNPKKVVLVLRSWIEPS
ncbi:MAG: flagellar basal-body MS-ring/collar protein FliF [Candidatus Sumerlaeia bacterium]